MAKRLENRIAVVTGASRGIGFALSKALAKEGAHVVAVARTHGGLEELDDQITAAGGTVTLVPADLTDFPAIDRLGAAIYERWGHLDILIGNAGMLGKLSPVDHIDPTGWQKVMDINVTANWRLIRSLHPLLLQADHGRAVFVSSGAAHKCLPYWGAYSVSKAALEALVKTYAAECASTRIKANLLNPGPIRTKMRAQAMPGENPETLATPESLARVTVNLCLEDVKQNGACYDFRDSALYLRKT